MRSKPLLKLAPPPPGEGSGNYCSSCYTGRYPIAFPQDERSYLQLALKLDKAAVTG